MALSLAIKRLVSSTLLPRSLFTLSPTTTRASRFINTNAVHDFFVDKYDPFTPTWSLVRSLKDQMTDNKHFIHSVTREASTFHMTLPAGIGEENVAVSVEQNAVIITAEKDNCINRHSILLPEWCQADLIKAELKNSVMTLVIPKPKHDKKDLIYAVARTKDAVYLQLDLTILGKEDRLDRTILGKEDMKVEDVKVSIEQNALVIVVEGVIEGTGERGDYHCMINLPMDKKEYCKTDEIKARLKKGVMKVVVPVAEDKEEAVNEFSL